MPRPRESTPANAPRPGSKKDGLLHGFAGGLLGLALLKFSNPPIMEKWVSTPSDVYEFLLNSPWPIAWGYSLLAIVLIFAVLRIRTAFRGLGWLLALPAAWLGWQVVAASRTVDPQLSWPTVAHFGSVCACFYLGFFALHRLGDSMAFWLGILIGFALMLAAGWRQQFGGMEQTRQFFYTYMVPQMKEVPPEYLKKIASNRIFGTLFYPNALAGAVILFLPALLATLWRMDRALTAGARRFLIVVVAAAALACLYWSGSKGGWLLSLLLALLCLLRLPWSRKLKVLLVSALLVVGLAGFLWRYASFFQKGATSVSARMDYWRAAVAISASHPLVGTGPGTFRMAYDSIRPPGAEPTRLVHNDFLEQAACSGLPGFFFYSALVVGALLAGYPRRSIGSARQTDPAGPRFARGRSTDTSDAALNPDPGIRDWHIFAIWLGVLGWCLQGLFEFGLFLPALSWPAFIFLGWLARQSSERRGDPEPLPVTVAAGSPLR